MLKNSECVLGFFHDFKIMKEFPDGVVEVCRKCRLRKFFKHKGSNLHYLSYHLRQALQKDNRRFNKEYAAR